MRAGGLVLKPVGPGGEALASWLSPVLAGLAVDGLRLARPVAAPDGSWAVDGWTASAWADGVPATGRWETIVSAGCRLHAALAGAVPQRPAVLDRRRDVWARADRVAWDESDVSRVVADAAVARLLGRLDLARCAVADPDQLVHGDLTGNVLLADGQPPAVIDVSPYWRPARWASAVVAVDAVAWHALAPGDAPGVVGGECPEQMLLRAAAFRLLSGAADDAARYEPVVELVESACT